MSSDTLYSVYGDVLEMDGVYWHTRKAKYCQQHGIYPNDQQLRELATLEEERLRQAQLPKGHLDQATTLGLDKNKPSLIPAMCGVHRQSFFFFFFFSNALRAYAR